jgi:hypothetical protein
MGAEVGLPRRGIARGGKIRHHHHQKAADRRYQTKFGFSFDIILDAQKRGGERRFRIVDWQRAVNQHTQWMRRLVPFVHRIKFSTIKHAFMTLYDSS